jgi:hypothetical protein
MNVIELDRALRQLRLGGMAAVLETRLRQAQAEAMAPHRLDSLPGLRRTHSAHGPFTPAPPETGRLSRCRSDSR